jgi:hypothetical protein
VESSGKERFVRDSARERRMLDVEDEDDTSWPGATFAPTRTASRASPRDHPSTPEAAAIGTIIPAAKAPRTGPTARFTRSRPRPLSEQVPSMWVGPGPSLPNRECQPKL